MATQLSYKEQLLDPRLKNHGVYKISIGNNFYIGSAVNIQKRLRDHFCGLNANKHPNRYLQNAFNKYLDVSFEVLEYIEYPQSLIEREQFYITSLNPAYNICRQAGSPLGIRRSKESKKKYSFSKMGDKNPFYKAGQNHPQYGIPKSERTKNKISQSQLLSGWSRGDNNPAAKRGVLYDVEAGANYLFFNLKEVCSILKISYKGMVWAIRYKKFMHKRYYAEYFHVPHKTIFF